MIEHILRDKSPLHFSVLPTPLHKLEKLSAKLGVNLYIKRDDLTGFALGGNKTRKLDYLIAEAKAKGYDSLIAPGANQSNFCRMAAGAGIAAGMEAWLLLVGEKPDQPKGNLLMDDLLGAYRRHIDPESGEEEIEAAGQKLEEELSQKGRKVYRMPMGGSTPTGCLGYVNGFREIQNWSEKNDLHFHKILHASGSGGTQAGLLAGKLLAQYDTEIIGVSVGRDKENLTAVVTGLAESLTWNAGMAVNMQEVQVLDEYFGEGYGIETAEAQRAIELFARTEGIILDPVYTGKAAAGLLDLIESGRIKADENILFLHTGGSPRLFA